MEKFCIRLYLPRWEPLSHGIFDYYRFRVDLDCTWQDQKVWAGLGEYELRTCFLKEIGDSGSLLEKITKKKKGVV
jgi:hypothetical protein